MYKIMCNLGLLLFAQVTPFLCSSIPETGVTWAKIIFLQYVNIFTQFFNVLTSRDIVECFLKISRF